MNFNFDFRVLLVSLFGISQSFLNTINPILSIIIALLTIIFLLIKIRNEKNKTKT
jgi:hypothetical protein